MCGMYMISLYLDATELCKDASPYNERKNLWVHFCRPLENSNYFTLSAPWQILMVLTMVAIDRDMSRYHHGEVGIIGLPMTPLVWSVIFWVVYFLILLREILFASQYLLLGHQQQP